MVGYAALPLFMDPRTMGQPLSKNVRDYVLNTVGGNVGLRGWDSLAHQRQIMCEGPRAQQDQEPLCQVCRAMCATWLVGCETDRLEKVPGQAARNMFLAIHPTSGRVPDAAARGPSPRQPAFQRGLHGGVCCQGAMCVRAHTVSLHGRGMHTRLLTCFCLLHSSCDSHDQPTPSTTATSHVHPHPQSPDSRGCQAAAAQAAPSLRGQGV